VKNGKGSRPQIQEIQEPDDLVDPDTTDEDDEAADNAVLGWLEKLAPKPNAQP
jgi:hypothetical protein